MAQRWRGIIAGGATWRQQGFVKHGNDNESRDNITKPGIEADPPNKLAESIWRCKYVWY